MSSAPGAVVRDASVHAHWCELSLDAASRMNTPKPCEMPVILAVDDNLDNLVLLEYQLLTLKQCSFVTAMTGNDALTLAKRQTPDLILMDIQLPDIDGAEVIRKLRQCPLTAKIPIVAVTALARNEDRDRILASGCNDYLSKPYDLDDLEAIICRHLPQDCPL